jgi:hypothetical protein
MKSPTMRKEANGVYSLTYETQYDLCMSFVRVQEYYESPEFKDKVFSLEEFIDYWSNEFGNGCFDYPVKWAGFNIPGKVLANWYELNSNTIRDKEKVLIDKVNARIKKDKLKMEEIYLIGVYNQSQNKKLVINHELAHALYSLDKDYKLKCEKIFEKIESDDMGKLCIESIKEELHDMGYGENVFMDEIQAYWSTFEKIPPISLSGNVWNEILEFSKLFKESTK